MFLSSLTLSNTSSFLTRSVHLIFSSPRFKKCSGISALLSVVSRFPHHTSYAPDVALYWLMCLYFQNVCTLLYINCRASLCVWPLSSRGTNK
jgi:hypothetical protein